MKVRVIWILVFSSAELFGISLRDARAIAKQVAAVVSKWREVASAGRVVEMMTCR